VVIIVKKLVKKQVEKGFNYKFAVVGMLFVAIVFAISLLWAEGQNGVTREKQPVAQFQITNASICVTAVAEGSTVTFDYVMGTVSNDKDNPVKVVETSSEEEAVKNGIYNSFYQYSPATFKLNGSTIIRGLEKALIGMTAGEEKRKVLVSAADAYGEYNQSFVRQLPLTALLWNGELQKNLRVVLRTPSGEGVLGTLLDYNETTALVDFNHPLAGMNLIYNVKVLKVENGSC
jgi:FKBP-type peptidyl-prolyl cis-trans isomerase 2